jgi:hypothetical protein
MITSITPSLEPSAIVVAAPYAPSGQIISGTSETAITIPTAPPFGNYVWTIVETNIGFRIGMRVRAAAVDATAGTTTWMEGVIIAWDETNVTVAVDLVSGFGLHNAWNVNVTGQPGQPGQTGLQGPPGIQGPAWGTGVPIDSPIFTGVPTSLFTPGQGTTHAADSTLATTLFATTAVNAAKIDTALTGNPTSPTQPVGDNSTHIATTAFVTASFAPISNPVFLGDPRAPTPAVGDNDTSIATTAFVTASFAPIASPIFTGTPKAPTVIASDNSTSLATTAFVARAVAPLAPLISPAFGGQPTAITPNTSSNDTSLATTAFVQSTILPLAPLISPHFTGTAPYPASVTPPTTSFDSSIATTAFVKTLTAQLAPLQSPVFTQNPTAPTQPPAAYDSTLATTAFVKTNAAGYQPLSADLTSLASASGAGVMYYRSAAGTWSPVEIGANVTFDSGVLSAAGGATGSGGIPEAPTTGTYFSRRNATWAADPIQSDAPSDGGNYVRLNATWTNITTALAAYAPINAPTFTGDAKAVTAGLHDNDTSIATTAYVQTELSYYAPLASPPLTGVPTAPTPAAASNDGTIATTAFVKTTTSTLAPINAPTFTGDAKAVTPLAGDNDTSIATTAFVTTAIAGKADASAVAATYAPLASPTFTGDAKAVTPASGDNDTSIATTQFVARDFAPILNPVFTGTPKLTTTPVSTDNSTALASTAFVQTAMSSAGGATVPHVQIFTSSGTYVPTANMLFAIIEVVGSGGGGGGTQGLGGYIYSGGGGGSGGYSRAYRTAAAIGSSVAVGIGTPGAGGVGNTAGGDGGDCSFGAICIAKGGKGGAFSTATPPVVGGAGGVAGTGDILASGNSGESGGWFNNTDNSAATYKGRGGPSALGGGGVPPLYNTTGAAGSNYGAGGNGGVSTAAVQSGGAGAPGIVIVTEFVSVTSLPAGAPVTPQAAVRGGFLSYVDGQHLKFAPYKGNQIVINGAIYAIPPTTGIAGLTNTGAFVNGVSGQSLAPTTTYYVHAFSNGGVVTADFVPDTTAGHSTSTTTGNIGTEIKSGDDSRSLIGIIRTTSDTPGQFIDTEQSRYVRSWFNRRRSTLNNWFTQPRSTTSNTYAELNTEIRINWVSFADDTISFSFSGSCSSTTATNLFTSMGIDSATVCQDVYSVMQNYADGHSQNAAFTHNVLGLAEGWHWATILGSIAAGSLLYNPVTNTPGARPTFKAVIG